MKILFYISIFFLISNCSFNLVDDHHGVFFLEKKEKKIKVNESNTNDILSVFGEPSTKSTFDNDIWIYIERKITNTHFFGRRKLVVNNVMVLEIDGDRRRISLGVKQCQPKHYNPTFDDVFHDPAKQGANHKRHQHGHQ